MIGLFALEDALDAVAHGLLHQPDIADSCVMPLGSSEAA